MSTDATSQPTLQERIKSAEAEEVFAAFREFVRASSQYIPPQIPVTCRGETLMFGRETLKQVGYKKAIEIFRIRFQNPEDFAEFPSLLGLNQTVNMRPHITTLVTFIGASTSVQKAGVLDPSSWGELMGNVETIEVIITKATEDSF